MHKTTFETLWHQYLESKAKAHGVVDGDLSRVRASVKSTLVTAGWATNKGDVSFVTKQDFIGCITAAVKVIDTLAPTVAASRRVSREQVMTASAQRVPTKVSANLESVATLNTFQPMMASLGDKCPRCMSGMQPVALVNERAALYCSRDRVVLPLPSGTQVRDA